MADTRTNEALEKLNRGIQESRRTVQQQTMQLAQEYFGDSVEELKQQVRESRATLEKLPDQVPGGQEESFQMLFQELMSNYSKIEECLGEAQNNVANLDTEYLIRQEEIEASDAARREAQELGVDLTQVEGTGSGGRIVVDDVRNFAEKMEGDGVKASDAARRKAEELGIDLSQVEGTGSDGGITVRDVTSLAEGAEGQAAQDTAGQAVQGAQDAVGGVAGQAQSALGQATGQAQEAAGEPRATNAARRKAEELGVDLSKVKGTGAGGLITIKDVVQS